MATVKKLGTLSFGKFFAIMGFMHGVFSVIAYFVIASLVNNIWAAKTAELQSRIIAEAGQYAAFAPQLNLPATLLPALSIWGILGIIVVSTLIGFVMGVTIAMNYNGISRLIGGLEMDLE